MLPFVLCLIHFIISYNDTCILTSTLYVLVCERSLYVMNVFLCTFISLYSHEAMNVFCCVGKYVCIRTFYVNSLCVRLIPYKEFSLFSLSLSLSFSFCLSHVETYISICSYTSLMFSNVFDLPVLIHVPICIIRMCMLNAHINLFICHPILLCFYFWIRLC